MTPTPEFEPRWRQRTLSVTGPVLLVMDVEMTHERFGSSSDPSINGFLHYPHDLDRTLNEVDVDKMHQYHTDYNNRPSHVIVPLMF
jgi:hypothetical protein